MAKQITITNGTGTADIVNGNYNIAANVNGYDNTSLLPATVDITEGTNTYAFTIGATGTLILHVSEDGTSSSTPIVGATFIRTDASGNEYGSVITTDASGNAVFTNVPYADSNAPVIYYKQTASDGDHEFVSTVQNTAMTTSTATVEIQNAPGAQRTINLTDANYSGLPVESGQLSLE